MTDLTLMQTISALVPRRSCGPQLPGSGADDGVGVADLLMSVTVLINVADYQVERKNLTVVGMSGDLKVD